MIDGARRLALAVALSLGAGCYASHTTDARDGAPFDASGSGDGGVTARDTGVGTHDAGVTTRDGGDAGCVAGTDCRTDRPCERGLLECVSGVPLCVVVGPALAGVPCRDAAVECDVAEACDGVSYACPADGFAALGTTCSSGSCDGCDHCTFDPCIAGALCNAGDPCRTGHVVCVCERVCIPDPDVVPPGTPCDDGDVCTMHDVCDESGTCRGTRTCGG